MLRAFLCVLCASVVQTISAERAEAQAYPRVIIQTDLGNIEVEIDTAHAPLTAANFLRYVDLGFYRFGRFHRTVRADNQPDSKVKIAVVQAGLDSSGQGLSADQARAHQRHQAAAQGRHHLDGAGRPGYRHVRFLHLRGDQPALDFGGKRNPDGQGFAAFGRVMLGMDVVRKINAAPAKGQALEPAVRIKNIVRKRA